MDAPFPEFLAAFDRAALERQRGAVVALDPELVMVWANPAWARFADDNGAPDLTRRFPLGASYLDGIGEALRWFYDRSFRSTLTTKQPFEQDYECSSPEIERRFRLRALPIDGRGLLVEHTLVVERPHDPPSIVLEGVSYRDDDGLCHQCSNCRRVRRSDDSAWDWIPAWVATSPESTSHGICPPCLGYYWGAPRGRR
jgi:hypothetical protein